MEGLRVSSSVLSPQGRIQKPGLCPGIANSYVQQASHWETGFGSFALQPIEANKPDLL